MATALLFGIPQGYVKTAKSAIERNDGLFTGWSIKYLPLKWQLPAAFHRGIFPNSNK